MKRSIEIHILRARLAACAWLVLCAGGSGCDSPFQPGSHIDRLRLLALSAEQPFVRPGERASLTLLVADAQGQEAEPPRFAWASCAQPEATSVDACLRALDGEWTEYDPSTGPLELEIPGDALSGLPDSARPSAFHGVAVVACPGSIASGDTSGVPVTCRDPGGSLLPITEFDVGVKRIFVRERDRNDNPRIAGLRWDGRAWPEDEIPTALPCAAGIDDVEDCPERTQHRISIDARAAEAGIDENGTKFDEQLIVQAYATQGVFRDEVRIAEDGAHVWAAQAVRGEELATLWFVVRDDRGGVGWATRRVRVR
jgi:hypothetical protein